jgi:hypothetical protein
MEKKNCQQKNLRVKISESKKKEEKKKKKEKNQLYLKILK